MTRNEKIAKAHELRDARKNNREIAECLGVTPAAVWKWLHPAAVKAWNRRENARRGPEKRIWEDGARATCPGCGSEMGIGSAMPSKATERCGGCVRDAARSRTIRYIELREAGKLNREIAAAEQVTEQSVATLFSRAHRYGLVVPPPPYWSRGKVAA